MKTKEFDCIIDRIDNASDYEIGLLFGAFCVDSIEALISSIKKHNAEKVFFDIIGR